MAEEGSGDVTQGTCQTIACAWPVVACLRIGVDVAALRAINSLCTGPGWAVGRCPTTIMAGCSGRANGLLASWPAGAALALATCE